MQNNKLKIKIESVRQKLIEMTSSGENFTESEQILNMSEKLDKLIVKSIKQSS